MESNDKLLIENIINTYEDNIVLVFKKILDKTLIEASNLKLDKIDIYALVYDKFNEVYSYLANIYGVNINTYKESMSDSLNERICLLTDKYFEDAIDELAVIAKSVRDSKNIEEMNNNYDYLMNYLNRECFREVDDIISSVKIR